MISMNWVKDFVDLDNLDLFDVATKVTTSGINVEKVISNHIDNIVTGEVISCIPHPDSDHLHVCMVNVGKDELIQIVCGAPNVSEGIKVIVALPGALLPGDFLIKSGKIRGVESNGMICALFELGLEEKNEENYNKGIEILPNDISVGIDPLSYLGYDDTLYELDIHKHRNNDCLYHIGFAYEVGTVLDKKVNVKKPKYKEIDDDINNYIKLKVDTDKCPLYIGRMVKDVKIKDSPDFIKKRLIAAGMRSINNVVDISNYVMLEYGQPTHFFDYDKLGNNVLVRNAFDQEKIITLEKEEKILDANDIVITDGKNRKCIAGIKGGESVEVDLNTKNIFIESAIFDAVSIRNTAEKLNLKSDASIRYGKGLNFEYTYEAMDRCLELLELYADAKIVKGSLIHDKIDKTPKIVKFKYEDINNLLGIEISKKDMEHELKRLQFDYKIENDYFIVTIPNRRLDIEPNINDMAEEIGRLYGYQNLKNTYPIVPTKRGVYKEEIGMRKIISRRLRSLGLNEVKTYTLVSPKMAEEFNYNNIDNYILPNPLSSDKSVLRNTIIPSLINVYEYNKARKVSNINIYECSQTFDSNLNKDIKVAGLMYGNYLNNSALKIDVKVDFYVVKGIVESILSYLGFNNRYSFKIMENNNCFHPGISAEILLDREIIGVIGRVHPTILKEDVYVFEFSISKLYSYQTKQLKYKEASKYPSIIKDVCFILDKNITNEEVISVIKKAGGRILDDIKIFDIYEMNDKKSYAYKLTFKDLNKTLTEKEVMDVFEKIINETKNKLNCEIRDK